MNYKTGKLLLLIVIDIIFRILKWWGGSQNTLIVHGTLKELARFCGTILGVFFEIWQLASSS